MKQEVMVSLSLTAYTLGNMREAKQHLVEALQHKIEISTYLTIISAIPFIAFLLIDQDEVERGVELYALASRYPFVANSRWFEDVAGRQIAAIAATLLPEIVTAAQERGRTRDLWETVRELLAELER